MRLVFVLLLATACTAHDVRTRFPLTSATEPSGTLVLELTQPADDVTVSLNGVLVVDKVHTQHIVIEGVPYGTAEIILAANGGDKEFKVWVGSDHATTVPLGIPEAGTGFIKTLAGTLITILVYSLLH